MGRAALLAHHHAEAATPALGQADAGDFVPFRAQKFQVQIFGGLQFQNGPAAGAGDAKKIQDSFRKLYRQDAPELLAEFLARELFGAARELLK